MDPRANFPNAPLAYFDGDWERAHRMPRAELEALQLEGVRQRFGGMRDALPVVKAMADAQHVDAIEVLEDIAPLLLPMALYKSYPEELLIAKDFPALTRWLDRLTTVDLSPLFDRAFEAIDDWLEALEEATPLLPFHSSGTSGRLSFFPRSRIEFDQIVSVYVANFNYWYQTDTRDYAVLWPGHASGRSGLLRSPMIYRRGFGRGPRDFVPLFEGHNSADMLYFVIRNREAQAKGTRPVIPISDHLRAQIDQMREENENYGRHVEHMLDRLQGDLRGRKLILSGALLTVYHLAKAGLERNMSHAFPKGSLLRTAGGLKGQPEIPNMREDIARFTGPCRSTDSYGMTEISSGLTACSQGNYHPPPFLIPFLIDAETGATLPREGRQHGIVGFFDLLPQTYWGGIMSLDKVTIDWEPCRCGNTTPCVLPGIERSFEPDFGDADYRCAASRQAVEAGLEELTASLAPTG